MNNKKIYISFIFILSLFLFTACNNNSNINTSIIKESSNINNEQNEIIIVDFEATVLKVSDNSILVKPVDNSTELNSSNQIYVNYKDIKIPFELKEGQIIKIEYDGLIAESYPAQINNVFKISLIKDVIEDNNNNSKDFSNLNNSQEKWGIVLETENVTSKGLTIICHQLDESKADELITGSFYVIQKLEKESYIDIENLNNDCIFWTAEAYSINKNSITTWDINWEFLYGELPVGKYRIGKEITNLKGMNDFENEIIYANFEIK